MRIYLSTLFFVLFIGISATAVQAQVASAELETETLTVKGIGCQGDLPIIKKNVEALEGVKEWKALDEPGPKTDFQVVFDPAKIDREKIVDAVEDSPCCDHPDTKPYKVKKGKKKKK